MEGKNQSFTDLFGAKESPPTPSSSTGIFATMFPPPSTSDVMRPPTNEVWNPKQARSDKKKKNSKLQDERVEPCHLSSSLYYGGQDVYSQSSGNRTPASYPQFKKDGEGDGNGNNSQSASRGNWWQGSLYY